MEIDRDLCRFVALRRLPPHVRQATVHLWEQRTLLSGEVLWQEGAPGRNLALLLQGEVRISRGEHELARVRAPDLLGELSAFATGARRAGTVRAITGGELLVLTSDHLEVIRRSNPDFFAQLLRMALGAAARRIQDADRHIARLSRGVLPAPPPASRRARRVRSAIRAVPTSRCPPIEPLLDDLLQDMADPPLRKLLATCFEPRYLQGGEVVFREGEPGHGACLVAEGEIHVVRYVRRRRADILARLAPGDAFGLAASAVRGHRTATCLAPLPAWIYDLDPGLFDSLPQVARIAWWRFALLALGVQLRNANRILTRTQAGLHRGGPLSGTEYQALLAAAGALRFSRWRDPEGVPGADPTPGAGGEP